VRRLLIAPIPVIIAVLLQIPLPSPSPGPSKISQEYQNHRNSESHESARGESPQPSTLIIAQIKTSNQKEDGSEPASDKWWIVGFTAALVVFSGLQFWAMYKQAHYMKRGLRISIKQTRIAARSAATAKLSAETSKRSLEVLEGADITPETITISGDTETIVPSSTITVVLRNHGRTLRRSRGIYRPCFPRMTQPA